MKYPWGTGSTLAKPLDGLALAGRVKEDLRKRVQALAGRGVQPGLATLLIGEDPASQVYVSMKHRDCKEIGIASFDVRLPADATQEQALAAIDELNTDPAVTAYIVQLPVPDHLDATELLTRMDPGKDADGLHPTNLGRLVQDISGKGKFPRPCTPAGIIKLLREYGVELKGAQVCVVGRGLTVGRPISLMLSTRDVGATAVLCHTGTRDIEHLMRQADVIIGAAGVPGLITADCVKDGAAVVDVGVSRAGGKIAGDAAPGVETKAAWLTPNPGGVGPMTRAMLLSNVVEIAESP